MLDALTARTEAGETCAPAKASCTHWPISDQFALVSNTCESGTPGAWRWLYSRWPIPA